MVWFRTPPALRRSIALNRLFFLPYRNVHTANVSALLAEDGIQCQCSLAPWRSPTIQFARCPRLERQQRVDNLVPVNNGYPLRAIDHTRCNAFHRAIFRRYNRAIVHPRVFQAEIHHSAKEGQPTGMLSRLPVALATSPHECRYHRLKGSHPHACDQVQHPCLAPHSGKSPIPPGNHRQTA